MYARVDTTLSGFSEEIKAKEPFELARIYETFKKKIALTWWHGNILTIYVNNLTQIITGYFSADPRVYGVSDLHRDTLKSTQCEGKSITLHLKIDPDKLKVTLNGKAKFGWFQVKIDYTARFSNVDLNVKLDFESKSNSLIVQSIQLENINDISLNDNIYHKYDKIAQFIRDKFIEKVRDYIDKSSIQKLIQREIDAKLKDHLDQLKFSIK